MPIRLILIDSAIRSAWSRMIHLWKPMAAWTFIVWLLLTIFLVPFTSALVGWGLLRGDRLVVSNEDIIQWALSPLGVSYILIVGSMAIIGSIVRFAGLFQIIYQDIKRTPPSFFSVLNIIVSKVPTLFKASVLSILGAILLIIIAGGGVSLCYHIFLGEFDINYYLVNQPTEWIHFLISAGTWLIIWGFFTLYLLGRSFLALPAYIDCDISLISALKKAWEISGSQTIRLLRLLAVSAAIWIFTVFVFESSFLYAVTVVAEWVMDSSSGTRPLLFLAGGYILASQLMRVILGFLGFSFITSLVSKFYLENTKLYTEGRPAPRLSELSSRFGSFILRWLKPVRIIVVISLFFVGSMFASGFVLSSIPSGEDVVISAHRGGPPPTPENTLAALEQAIAEGADFSEIDVQRTADGVVVLMHDLDLMRVANDPRRVTDVNFDEIRNIVQISEDNSPFTMKKIVTLNDFLEQSRGRINTMIELKYYNNDPRLVRDVVQIIQNLGMREEVLVMSMSLQALRELQNLDPEIKRGFVSAVAVGDLSRLPVQFLAVNQTQINSALIRSAHRQNMEVFAWTVNKSDDIVRMINLGVNGLITDYPAFTAEIRREISDMTIAERLMLNLTGWITQDDSENKARDQLQELIR